MLIDVSTYVGHWPFRKVDGATLNELAPVLAKHKITHAIVSNVNGIFYKDAMEGNLELYEELKNYKGEVEFIPFAVINPSYINWREDMEKCVKELGFKGFDFTPAYHKHVLGEVCTLSDPCYKEAFKFAGELGVPVRIEIGPRDIENNVCVAVRRDNGEKTVISLDNLEEEVTKLLDSVTQGLYNKALASRDSMTNVATDLEGMIETADTKPGFIKAMWCGDRECEETLKEKAGVSSRCMPFEQENITDKCVCCGKPAKKMVYWGKAY